MHKGLGRRSGYGRHHPVIDRPAPGTFQQSIGVLHLDGYCLVGHIHRGRKVVEHGPELHLDAHVPVPPTVSATLLIVRPFAVVDVALTQLQHQLPELPGRRVLLRLDPVPTDHRDYDVGLG